LTFSVPGVTPATAPITASGNLILLAKPSQLGGTGGIVTLTLLNGNGTPVPGVQLTGTCSNAGIITGPGVTNSAGQTTANIGANLNIPNAPGSGSCTFTTATGSPTVTVTLKGTDPCLAGTSPPPAGCSSSSTNVTLTVQLQSATANTGGYGSVSANPALTIDPCTMTSTTAVSCTGSYASGKTVTLTATLAGPATGVTWGGACAPAGNATSVTLTLTSNTTCSATFQP
jgi:hypothetical protein